MEVDQAKTVCMMCLLFTQVLIVENPDALVAPTDDEATAGKGNTSGNPLAWLSPDLPSHIKASVMSEKFRRPLSCCVLVGTAGRCTCDAHLD